MSATYHSDSDSDHHDSEHGYTHFTLIVERVPGIDTDELFDKLTEVIYDLCEGFTGEDDFHAFEHYEYSTGTKCLFPDEGEAMTRHT